MRELERDNPATAASEPPAMMGPLAVIGTGRAGGSIARAARSAGFDVSLTGRELVVPSATETVLLCVPDRELSTVAAALPGAIPAGSIVGHTSGASDLSVLAPAEEAGHPVFSIHPLQTMPSPETDLTGAPCAIAASDAATLASARALASSLGLRPFEVPEASRAAYHAAASIASNFLIALEESATEALAAAGVENPREVLAPLVLRTAANWADQGAAALTGPIARGDEETVARHTAALAESAPWLLPLYEVLAERTRSIGEQA